MADIKITQSSIDENCEFSPKKYFISKHSIYPSKVSIDICSKFDVDLFFNRIFDKFEGFTNIVEIFMSNGVRRYKSFVFINENKNDTIIFQYKDRCFKYYAKTIDEGLIHIVNEILESCYEKTF